MESTFLTNYTDKTFLDEIKDDLRQCSSFSFSVSFIKKAGLVLLLTDIKAALERGAHGRIITSTYQNFTDIDSLRTFAVLQTIYPNFTCHLDFDSFHDDAFMVIGYHSKGYLFEYPDNMCKVVVGSSNITRSALKSNIEWDIAVEESLPSKVYNRALSEFEDKWQGTHDLTDDIIRQYMTRLDYAIERWDMDYDLEHVPATPNYMQKKALKELNRYRSTGVNKALIIAAAGSGKTFLAAFDAYNFNPNKLLYVVHEGAILNKSLETFRAIFGISKSFGIYGGGSKDINADFLFATNVSIASNLELFTPDYFDYIIIDECHRAAAPTYKKIMDYFKPEFMLGLTATPERMDNQDIFELFDTNVPFELRMREALINDLIVPFHYYGIRDELVDYGLTGKEERRLISQMVTDEHVAFIHDEMEKHRDGIPGKLKALVFCRNVQHAQMMSEALSAFYTSAYLTGKNDIGSRIRAYNELQNDDSPLETLCTVDILNEGVDIPAINMVVFLRPTESQTIFIQQLGRGLRKYPGKEFVTVLDFVGNNYKRSLQIMLALGSLSKNFVLEKKLLAALLIDDFKPLGLAEYGVEIHIDELSKEEIAEYIRNENFNRINYIKQDYCNFKKFINADSYPSHMDYLNSDCAPDLIKFMNIKMENKKTRSYYSFLKGIGEETIPAFSDEQVEFINYLSEMLPLVRKYEYLIFKDLVDGENDPAALKSNVKEQMLKFSEKEYTHATEYINKNGFALINESRAELNVSLSKQLKEYLADLIEYGLTRYDVELGDCEETFKLWHNYRKDQAKLKICANPGDTMKGTDVKDKTVYVYVGLKKDLSEDDRLNYKDKFIAPDVLQWECEAGISDAEKNKIENSDKVIMFVRKVDNEYGVTLPFTYVGEGKMTNRRNLDNAGKTALFDIVMDNELPEYLQFDFMNFK